jgi:RNA polymerase sigma-70 factor (ECF subfamily)
MEISSLQMAVRPERWSAVAAERMAIAPRRRFENLLNNHGTRVRRLAFGMLGDSHAAEDALQEAFIRAYRALPPSFASDAQEAVWLYRIVQRCCLNEIRSRRRRPEVSGVPDAATAPERDDRGVIVVDALGDLRPEARAVVLLVDMLGLSYDDAAASVGVPRGTIASRLTAARSERRAALLQRGIGPQ